MHTKVFVGNLSFKTRAEELAREFSAAGKVVSANIITRGPRSLGYGFVEMETEEEAQKAVALLNKKSIDGREINVEIAKPRDEAKIAERRQAGGGSDGGGRRFRGRGRGRGGAPHFEGGPPPPFQEGETSPGGGRGGGFRGRRFRGGGRGGANNSPGGGPPPAGGDANNNDNNGGGGRGGFRRGGGRYGGERRGGGRGRDLAGRSQSSTTLFVANLPFSLDDAGLANLFKDHKVSKAHVVKNRNNRSKGFGFVEFENEAGQKTALTAAEKMVVEGRELIVKIALTMPEGAPGAPGAAPSGGGAGGNGGGAAAASSSSGSSSSGTPAETKSAAKAEAPKST